MALINRYGDGELVDRIRLGRTEMMVSRAGFGGVPIQRVSEEEAIAIVRRCLDLGVNFLDTAVGYTNSEERIGRAIAGRREDVHIATKAMARTRDMMEQHLELSLQRLGVDYIDLYQLHSVSEPETLEVVLAPSGPLAVLEDARESGVVRHIGVTSHNLEVAKDAVRSGRFDTVQYPFNVINREPGNELLALARQQDMGFIAMKPLAGGRLTNAAIAVKYLLQFPDVLPIPGIERLSDIEEIAQILEGPLELSDAERQEMERMREELGTLFCRRCDYCQPCTAGIPISSALTISNPEKRMPPERVFHGFIDDLLTRAAECTECGDCEERCPYHLPIREMLRREVDWYREEKRRYLEGLDGG